MIEQGTPEWKQQRLGLATASRFKDVLATIKSGEAAARRNYRAQLIVERLTNTIQESYENDAMRYGKTTEPYARLAYEAFTGHLVVETGFIRHPSLMAGCSPDGLIGDAGGCEIKCPYQSAVHIETLLRGMPADHIAQVQGNLWITGRQWWDFISYDPRMPPALQIRVIRIMRDETYIAQMETAVKLFLESVELEMSELSKIIETTKRLEIE